MGDEKEPPRQPEQAAEPEQALLSEMRTLRRQTRAVRHGYWFPLVLFGILSCAAVPFYLGTLMSQGSPGSLATSQSVPLLPYLGGSSPDVAGDGGGYYWLAALLTGVLATYLWYRWRARRVGVQTPSLAFLIVTLILIAVTVAFPLLSRPGSPALLRHLPALWPGDLVIRGTFPFVLIAAGLLILAWAERSWVLGGVAAVYTGAALLASLYDVSNLTQRLGWALAPGDELLPNVLLPALVLLLAGASTLAVRRLRRTSP